MKLVIVESPTKKTTIQRYLGDDYVVTASKGHIRDLATSGKGGLGIDVEHDFKPTYINDKTKTAIIKQLKSEAKKADEIILATDPDREGESISWHLAELLGLDVNKTKRLEFNEITKEALENAMLNPRTVNMDLVSSQETRRLLDRIIGFKLSKLLSKKIKADSAGRVQSAVLKLIVDHEKVIKAFIAEEYWNLSLLITHDDHEVEIKFVRDKNGNKKINNEASVDAIINSLDMNMTVSDVKVAKKSKEPNLPFTTSSLQQEAFNKFSYSTKRTQSIAQRLYEGLEFDGEHHGLVSYIRTDSTRLSENFVVKAKSHIENTFGNEYLRTTKLFKKGKKTENIQDAHEAIRPTDLSITPKSIKGKVKAEEYNLYSLIYARTLASLMTPAIDETINVTFTSNGHEFATDGVRNIFKGYRVIYGEFDSAKDREIDAYYHGEKCSIVKPVKEQKFTQPPSRYSEARIVKRMEELGIGRPSTYSSTIETLKRQYIEVNKGVITPTEKGILAVETLEKFFVDFIDAKFTSSMEKRLDLIAEGKDDKVKLLTEFYNPFIELLSTADQGIVKVQDELVGEACPECGAPLVYKEGRYGKFIACSAFPKCRYTRPIIQLAGEDCPVCGHPLVVKRTKNAKGRIVTFTGCSNYPNCTYIKPLENRKFTPKKKDEKAT